MNLTTSSVFNDMEACLNRERQETKAMLPDIDNDFS